MSRSKRRHPGGSGKGRDRARETRARETQTAQRRAEKRAISPAQYRRRRTIGWAMVVLAVVVGVQHWLSHLGLFTVISSGWDDLLVGYPMAVLLGIGGTVVLSKA